MHGGVAATVVGCCGRPSPHPRFPCRISHAGPARARPFDHGAATDPDTLTRPPRTPPEPGSRFGAGCCRHSAGAPRCSRGPPCAFRPPSLRYSRLHLFCRPASSHRARRSRSRRAATPVASSALPRRKPPPTPSKLVAAARADEIAIAIDPFQTNEPCRCPPPPRSYRTKTPTAGQHRGRAGRRRHLPPARRLGHNSPALRPIATVVHGGAADVRTFALEIPEAPPPRRPARRPAHTFEIGPDLPRSFYAPLLAALAAFVLGGLLALLAGRSIRSRDDPGGRAGTVAGGPAARA